MGDSKVMATHEAICTIMERAGKTAYRVSVDLGHSPSYASRVLKKLREFGSGDVPTVSMSTIADIADVCGYDVALVPRGKGAPIRISCERGE